MLADTNMVVGEIDMDNVAFVLDHDNICIICCSNYEFGKQLNENVWQMEKESAED